MRVMNLEPQHARRYFEARLKGRRLIQRGILEIEEKVSHCDHDTARANVAQL